MSVAAGAFQKLFLSFGKSLLQFFLRKMVLV